MSKRELILDLLVNGLLPWIGYVFLQNQYGWSDYHALLAVTVIPGFFAIVGIVRKGRPDLVATVSLVTILLSLVMAAATEDTRVLQIRESYITLLMGIVFVLSGFFKKPLLWIIARHQVKSEDQREKIEHPAIRKMLGTVNAVWGWSFLFEFGFKLWMIDNLSIERVLALSPVMFYGVTAITCVWTFWWLRRQTRPAGGFAPIRRAKTEAPSNETRPDFPTESPPANERVPDCSSPEPR